MEPIAAVAERLTDLWESPQWEPLGVSADALGHPILLELAITPGDHSAGVERFTRTHAERPQYYRIRHELPGDRRLLTLPETREYCHHVQPLEEGYLVVRGRSQGDRDPNAHVFSLVGEPQRSFFVGDGVEDVQTTPSGRIWISYFDAGTPASLSGVAGFDADGRMVFRSDKSDLPPVQDCFAMTVLGDEDLWFYAQPGSNLVHLGDRRCKARHAEFPLRGTTGFAVDGGRALMQGGDDAPDQLFLVTLDTLAIREVSPTNRQGEHLPVLKAFGRGSTLFFATAEGLYRLDLKNL